MKSNGWMRGWHLFTRNLVWNPWHIQNAAKMCQTPLVSTQLKCSTHRLSLPSIVDTPWIRILSACGSPGLHISEMKGNVLVRQCLLLALWLLACMYICLLFEFRGGGKNVDDRDAKHRHTSDGSPMRHTRPNRSVHYFWWVLGMPLVMCACW